MSNLNYNSFFNKIYYIIIITLSQKTISRQGFFTKIFRKEYKSRSINQIDHFFITLS